MGVEEIRELLAKVSPGVNWSEVGPAESLGDAGLDSLDKASFFLEVETASGVRIPDAVYEEIDSLEGVAAAVNGGG